MRESAVSLLNPNMTSLHDYMSRCNAKYYSTRDAIGARGDFITAPEISQMFGEILGAWAAMRWQQMGRPAPFQLIEMGPGKGTLMADVLRVFTRVPGMIEAVHVHLVETSQSMRAAQAQKLSDISVTIEWHDTLLDIPAAPFILIANEFLDALPIRQFIYTLQGWQERGVAQTDHGHEWMTFETDASNVPTLPKYLPPPIPGNMVEDCPLVRPLVEHLAERMKQFTGTALFIDYGYARMDYGDTFQAVCKHEYADPLQRAGEQDLTAHVNFAAIEQWGRGAGMQLMGPIGQGEFLIQNGLRMRADKLLDGAKSGLEKLRIIEDAHRLTAPDEMGSLFKVICLSSPQLPEPAGFVVS